MTLDDKKQVEFVICKVTGKKLYYVKRNGQFSYIDENEYRKYEHSRMPH